MEHINLRHELERLVFQITSRRSEIYSALIKDDIVLHEIASVVDHDGNPLPFHHLNPKLSFPKLLPQSQGLKAEDQCPICK